MTEHTSITPTDLRHASLLALMSPEFEESLVVRVLKHKGELPNDVRRKLDSAINSVVKIPQFPNQPAIAPVPVVKQHILGQLDISESLANAVFQAWFASHETLYALVKGYLYGRDIEVEYPDFVNHKFREAWSSDDWISERDSILAVHESLNKNDVALMLCFATDKMPDSSRVEAKHEANMTNQNILSQARRFLDQLPADAPEWNSDIPDFIAWVSDITDRKKNERESVAAVEAVSGKIAELSKYSTVLEYFGTRLERLGGPGQFVLI